MKSILCVFCLVSVFIIGFFLGTAVTVAPKETITQNRILIIERDVRRYYKHTGQIPKTVTILSSAIKNDKDYDKDFYGMDGWGVPLHYCVSNKTITIWSNGRPISPVRCLYSLSFEVDQDGG